MSSSIASQRAAMRLRSPGVRAALAALFAAAVLLAGGGIALAMPAEGTLWGGTGAATGLLGVVVAGGMAMASRADRRKGKFWPGGLMWAILAVFVFAIGVSIVAGNFNIARVDLVVATKQSHLESSGKGHATIYEMWTDARRSPYRVSQSIYDGIRQGDRLRCSGPQSALMTFEFTRCVPIGRSG